MKRQAALRRILFVGFVFLALGFSDAMIGQSRKTDSGKVPPIDPQRVQDQDLMTWDDYRPIPGHNWADPTLKPERGFRFMIAGVMIFYTTVKCVRNPKYGPPVPVEERANFRARVASLKYIIFPLLLILLVLGVIYSGICPHGSFSHRRLRGSNLQLY